MEFQIQRARDMIDNLVPEIRKNMHVIAREEVEVEQLARQITDAETNLAKDKDGIMRLKADLSTDKDLFHYAGRTYSVGQVRTDLANRFERYKTAEATLASLKDVHEARQTSLDANRQKLEGMLAEKRKLAVEVENVEARLQMVAAAQTTNEYNFDDSKLGRAKELITDLKTRLEVAERMVNSEGYFHDEIPLADEAPADIVNRVAEYFGEKSQPEDEEVAKAN
jgi:chromosome segregation ATPase